MIIIRPHHLICFQSFIGKGYNKEFVNNLSLRLTMLNQNCTKQLIKLTFKADDICKCCPNLLNEICKNEKFINYLDNSYYKLLNLNINIIYSWNNINDIVKHNFNKSHLHKICNYCEWFSICNANKKINL